MSIGCSSSRDRRRRPLRRGGRRPAGPPGRPPPPGPPPGPPRPGAPTPAPGTAERGPPMGGRPERGGPPGRAPGEPVRTAAGTTATEAGRRRDRLARDRPGRRGRRDRLARRRTWAAGAVRSGPDGGRGGTLGRGRCRRRRWGGGPGGGLRGAGGRRHGGRGRAGRRRWRGGAGPLGHHRLVVAGQVLADRWSGWRCVRGSTPRRAAGRALLGLGPGPGPCQAQGLRRAARLRRLAAPAPSPPAHGRARVPAGVPRADGRPSRAWPPSRAPRAARRGRGLPVGPCGERGRPARPRCSTSGSSRRCRGSRRGRAPPCWSARAPSRARGRGSSLPSAYFTPFGALLLVGGDVDRAGARCTSLAHP